MSEGLSVRNLTFARGDRRIIDDVSLDLEPGSFTSLIGANGAGKTTLLRLLLGLSPTQSGTVMLDGRPLTSLSRRQIASRVAYVPQSHVPSFPFSVTEIVAMGRTPSSGWGARLSGADMRIVEAALERVNMEAFASRSYAELSGGERQAVLIARALAQDARILILDEPTASLDLGQQTRLMKTLSDLSGEGFAVLASLHHPDLALRWSRHAIVMKDGRILTQGAVRQALSSENLSVIYDLEIRVVEVRGKQFVVL